MKKLVTTEFTCYQLRDAFDHTTLYELALGDESLGTLESADEAFEAVKEVAKDRGFKDAGYTEVFGRNRQFIQGPRGGWKRYKDV